ncbi:MAG: hypothetical protein NZO16_04300 [Deltaproteobacteria bacterium]|nr:hypothetical protein [Deltaproteobacteria bacterium]
MRELITSSLSLITNNYYIRALNFISKSQDERTNKIGEAEQKQDTQEARPQEIDKDLEKLFLKKTLEELKGIVNQGLQPHHLTYKGFVLDRLNRSQEMTRYYLERRASLDQFKGSLLGIMTEMARQLDLIYRENPEIEKLVKKIAELEKVLVDRNKPEESREEAIKQILDLLKKGGKDLYRAIQLLDSKAQITAVLEEYVQKLGNIDPRTIKPHSLTQVVFEEISRKIVIARKTLLGEKITDELQKSKIDELIDPKAPESLFRNEI